MARQKFSIIGGGSAYVPGIIYSVAHSGSDLDGTEVCLMDVSTERLPMMKELGKRICEDAGAKIAVTQTTDRKAALRDATFILTNFRPGGLEGLRADEEIPIRHGVLGQETTGPGGTFYALRSIPEAIGLTRDIQKICPDAWVLNYLNPANFVADAIRRVTNIKCITICDGGGNGLRYTLSKLLGVEPRRVRVRAAGTNHHTWLLEVAVDGEDWYPRVKELIRAMPTQGHEGIAHATGYEGFQKWFLERYGFLPANVDYLYPYFNHADSLKRYEEGHHSLYKMFQRDLPEHWRDFEAMASGSRPVFMNPDKHHTHVGHGDIAINIMRSIVTNTEEEFHVNVPNDGCVTNMPAGAIVEVPAKIDRTGVHPLCMGALPKSVIGLATELVNWQELSVDAALSGRKDLVIQALLAHPWITSFEMAEKIAAELHAFHSKSLPMFAG